MIPFAETLLLWRTARGMTQAELARRARVPRPNLSAIERGKREVTLGTLRALALALDVRPGVLADGIAPNPPAAGPVSREALERVADAVVFGRRVRTKGERELASLIRTVVSDDEQAGHAARQRIGSRAMNAAWLRLKSGYEPALVASVLQRVRDRQRLR